MTSPARISALLLPSLSIPFSLSPLARVVYDSARAFNYRKEITGSRLRCPGKFVYLAFPWGRSRKLKGGGREKGGGRLKSERMGGGKWMVRLQVASFVIPPGGKDSSPEAYNSRILRKRKVHETTNPPRIISAASSETVLSFVF